MFETKPDVIVIDGSQGEGGGQMLRTSLSLAAVLGQPVRIVNIRAGRPKPGLAPQHLTACRAVAAVCQGELVGDELRSQEILLRPGSLHGGEFVFDISDIASSAGSVSLVFQALLPPLLFATRPSHVILRGGTDVPWSPVYAYLQEVFRPVLAHMGAHFRLQRNRAGFYPAGGGEIEAFVEPLRKPLQPLTLIERGVIRTLGCYSTVAACLPQHIAKRQCQGVIAQIADYGFVQTKEDQLPSGGPGTSCLAYAIFERGAAGFTALGERGRKAEDVGKEAGFQLREFLSSPATVDERLADQLQLYWALAEGHSTLLTRRLTGHLQTNATVIEQITGVSCEFNALQSAVRLDISGIGWHPQKKGGKTQNV